MFANSRIRLLAAAFGALILVAASVGASAATASGQRRSPTRVVVLVSGLDSTTPFSTPARACAGKEGSSWGLKGGVAAALRRAGFDVYTAPVRKGTAPPPASCARSVPGPSTWVTSTGEIDANGRALNRFLAFLHRTYHVGTVTLLGHSDGGLWSRSAIAGHRSAPTVEGLVTLGTPHLGSPVADVGVTTTGIECGAGGSACATVQKLASLLVTQLGPTAVAELSSPFLSTWNPQSKLAGCRVTTIEGTAIHPPPLRPPQPTPSRYYLPTDGLVGFSSAADRAAQALDGARIPAAAISRLVNGGAFPVYHTPGIGNPSELNDAAVNAALVRALRAPVARCLSTRIHRPSKLVVRLVSARQAGAHGGSLGSTARGDVVLAVGRVSVACGGKPLVASPLLPIPLLKTYVTGGCSALRASGLALLLHNTPSSAVLTLKGSALTVTVRGRKVSGLVLQVLRRGTWVRVPLRRGRATVPGGSLVQLRLTGRGAGGAAVTGVAPMTS